MAISNFSVDFDDVNISQEDLRDIDLLEACIFGETINLSSMTNPLNDLHEKDNTENSEDEVIRPPLKRRRRRLHVMASDSESETNSVDEAVANALANITSTSTSQKWSRPRGHQPSVVAFTETTGK